MQALTARLAWSRRRWRMAPALLLALAPVPAAAETRAPNAFEQAYTAMALDTGDHTLCARISPEAQTRALFNSPGTQIYRERSRCFLYAAVNTLNPALCPFVTEASAWFHDGSYYSRTTCERLVGAGNPFNFALSFDRRQVLAEMGYTEAEVGAAYPGDPADLAWHRFYLDKLGRDGDFQQRLARLPDFSGGAR